MSITIIPTGKKLIIKRLPAQEITLPSGIHLPENASSSLSEGEVIVVSKEIEHIYKPGDIILFPSKKGYLEPRLNGEYLWLDSTDTKEEIWGIVTQKNIQDKDDSL